MENNTDLQTIRRDLDLIAKRTRPGQWDKAWQMAGRVLIAVAIPSLAAFGAWLGELHSRVDANASKIALFEHVQFTREMGYAMEARLVTQMQQPPRWLTDAVLRLEKAIEKLEVKVAELEKK